MLVNMKEMLEQAHKKKAAVTCFNTPNFEIVRATVDAAEDLNLPVIISHAQAHMAEIPLDLIGPLMVDYAKQAKVPVCVHLDHGIDYDLVLTAIRCGFSSIMYDCSDMTFEDNIAALGEFTKYAHKVNITVEAELGQMSSTAGDSHGGPCLLSREEIRKTFTDPDMAAEFSERTQVDALAVCFGTVHGIYAEEPALDIDRVIEMRRKMPESTQLVMHGGSGVDAAQIRRAISAGISKINYYSYLSKSATRHVYELLQENNGDMFYHQVQEEAYRHMRKYARDIISMFRNA